MKTMSKEFVRNFWIRCLMKADKETYYAQKRYAKFVDPRLEQADWLVFNYNPYETFFIMNLFTKKPVYRMYRHTSGDVGWWTGSDGVVGITTFKEHELWDFFMLWDFYTEKDYAYWKMSQEHNMLLFSLTE